MFFDKCLKCLADNLFERRHRQTNENRPNGMIFTEIVCKFLEDENFGLGLDPAVSNGRQGLGGLHRYRYGDLSNVTVLWRGEGR